MEPSIDPTTRKDLMAVLAALAIWWLVPLMLTMGSLGHVGIVLLIVAVIAGYAIFHNHPVGVCLWAPLVLLSALTVGGIILLIVVLTGVFQPEGMTLVGAWILGLILPVLVCIEIVAFPALVGFVFLRPRFTSPQVVTAAVINAFLVVVACFVVSAPDRGEASVRSASITPEERPPGGSIFWLKAEPIYHRSNPSLTTVPSATDPKERR